jgi:DNA-binding transcriptional MocR family regulator
MNERIKELINQATVRGEEYLPGNDGHPTPTVYFDKEKFAELIVRECASMAESFHHHQYDFTGNLELHEFIKEHFGVEE